MGTVGARRRSILGLRSLTWLGSGSGSGPGSGLGFGLANPNPNQLPHRAREFSRRGATSGRRGYQSGDGAAAPRRRAPDAAGGCPRCRAGVTAQQEWPTRRIGRQGAHACAAAPPAGRGVNSGLRTEQHGAVVQAVPCYPPLRVRQVRDAPQREATIAQRRRLDLVRVKSSG